MAGLDGVAYARLLDELPSMLRAPRSSHAETDAIATTVVVTHVREEAFRLCDDLVVLVGGQIHAAGSKHDVATNPRRRSIAEVLGYTVLERGSRSVAIPDGAFQIASVLPDSPMVERSTATVHPTVEATVEAVVDLVREWDVIATTDGVRIHARMPRSQPPPDPGSRIALHAQVIYPIA